MNPKTIVAIFQFVCLPAHFWSWAWAKLLGINLVINEEAVIAARTKAVPRELVEKMQLPEGQTEAPDLYPIECPKCRERFFMAINKD